MPSDIFDPADAELLRLGAELDLVEQDFLRQCAADDKQLEEDADDKWAAIDKRLYPLFDQIMELTSATPTGLAVQAKAVGLAVSGLWDDRTIGIGKHERKFIEAVCRFAGVVPAEVKVKAHPMGCIVISDSLE
ncbi:MAG TPA: hypothetical protein VGJ20_28795 [Xanthobacteraceae bacterium]|jgi:hypothetical protein